MIMVMLVPICYVANSGDIQLWERHCDSEKDFVFKLLDSNKEEGDCPALVALIYHEKGLETLADLVKKVADVLGKMRRPKPFLKKVVDSRKKKSSPPLTEEFIHCQMLLVAYKSLELPRAFEVITSNFPLLNYTGQLPTEDFRTLLHGVIIMRQKPELVKTVIDLGVRYKSDRMKDQAVEFLDIQDKYGGTAVHYAVVHDNLQVLQLLLDEGAHAGLQNVLEDTPLHLTIQAVGSTMKEWVDAEESGVPPTLAAEHNFEIIDCFHRLRQGYPGQLEDEDVTPIFNDYEAHLNGTLKNCYRFTELLLRSKTCHVDTENEIGLTALHMALGPYPQISVEIVGCLLDAGADMNKPTNDNYNSTPLHLAILHRSPNLPLVEMLVACHNADPSKRDKAGKRPVHYLNQWNKQIEGLFEAHEDCEKIFQLLSVKCRR